jgi:acetoin utilization protein AcuB
MPWYVRKGIKILVGNRMTHNPITIGPDVSIAEAMESMKEKKVHRFPVVNKKNKLIGIVTYRDIIHATPSSATSLSMWEISYLLAKVKVKEVMSKNIIFATEDMPIEEAALRLSDNAIGGLPVLRDEKLIGIITESDLFRIFLEIFGARRKGIRLTVMVPYVKGSMARLTSAITDVGGLIIAFDTFEGNDSSNWGATIKVNEVRKELLLEAIKPHVLEVTDVREDA